MYALCAGCAPLKQCYNGFLLLYSFVDDTEAILEQVKVCVDLFWLPSNFGSHACWFSLRNPKFDYACRQKTLSMIVFMKCLSALLKFLRELIRTVALRCWNIVLRITSSLWILYDKFWINPSLLFFSGFPTSKPSGCTASPSVERSADAGNGDLYSWISCGQGNWKESYFRYIL